MPPLNSCLNLALSLNLPASIIAAIPVHCLNCTYDHKYCPLVLYHRIYSHLIDASEKYSFHHLSNPTSCHIL
ncbi:hypothetical protein AYI69_g2319 [Smittium culicis]|uniref:Uncharacterized protein n=1 Tax=Smittium culicis TaxID=133412 RepID=A0A1R1YMT4_9FUNG|nr:hypothetical protein AYI69_g2319 [Smittium culicis]